MDASTAFRYLKPAMAPAAPADIRTLARDLRALLAYQGQLGLGGLDVTPPAPARPRAEPPPVTARDEAARQIAALGAPGRDVTPAKAPPRPRPAPSSEGSVVPELRAIRDDLGECTRCKLHEGRTQVVFGVGNPRARLMFIGEGPGRDEDLQGEPFVGAAGQLLDRMIKAMGLARSDVYIANIVKCRPPQNRDPEPDEIEACEGFLRAQIRAVRPEVLVALGRVAAQTLLRESKPVSRLRGKWREYEGTPLMPTYHPAYLLRNPSEKRPVWDDLQEVMRRLGLGTAHQEP